MESRGAIGKLNNSGASYRNKPFVSYIRKAYSVPMTGDKLRAERQRRGMTQAQFAELIGTSQQRLSKLESAGGDLIPVQLRTMDRITRRLNGRPAEARTSTGR